MKKQVFGMILLGLLALASSASAQVWTSVGSGGAIEHNSSSTYAISNGTLFFRAGATGNVSSILNVTNPLDFGNPFWTTLEFTARNPGGGIGVFATAVLYRRPRFSASAIAVCSAVAPITGTLTTTTCTFSPGLIDFANNDYFIRVSLGRETTSQTVAAYGVRVY